MPFEFSNMRDDLIKIENEVQNTQKNLASFMNIFRDIAKIDFYAEATFEAEERTQWIVDVTLCICGKNGSSFSILADRKSVYKLPRYSYNEWREQKKSDRLEAEQVLKEMSEK